MKRFKIIKRITSILFLLFFIIFLLEICSFFTLKLLAGKGIVYSPRFESKEEYEMYLDRRNQTLGWPPTDNNSEQSRDSSSARYSPYFPDPSSRTCISIYGDSFTWGDEVGNEDTWGETLSSLINCRVSNFGVGGYGTDQSYLRFKKNINDNSKIVLLVHTTENILRNINQFRDLLYPGQGLGFKPRFVNSITGGLNLIPLPSYEYEKYLSVVIYPEKSLKYDYFLPGGQSGIQKVNFPYTLKIIGILNNYHIRAKIQGRPRFAEFYKYNHDSNGLELTSNIIKSFYEEAMILNKIPIVVIMPICEDLVYYSKRGKWVYQNLIDLLNQENIVPLNLGTELIKHLDKRNPKEFFNDCSGHFNEEGNKAIANIIFNHLEDLEVWQTSKDITLHNKEWKE